MSQSTSLCLFEKAPTLNPGLAFVTYARLVFWQRIMKPFVGVEIPAHLRADFTLLTAQHMREQARLMFCGMLVGLPVIVFISSPQSSDVVSYGLPFAAFAMLVSGLFLLRKPIEQEQDARAASRTVRKVCVSTATLGSMWCLANWLNASPDMRIYYPAIISLIAMALGFGLTAARGVAFSVLLIFLAPIGVALAGSAEPMNIALATGMAIAVGFQLVLISNHKLLLLHLVEERYSSERQARRDPLTGLANRRALMERFAQEAARKSHVRLMVIDIDRFKGVNDRHGHDMGDEVLRAFAQLLAIHARGNVCAARLGGEEFALFARAEALDPAIALQVLTEIRGAYMPHGESITASIGVADAAISSKDDWTGLYGRADRALYEAKNEGRNRVETCNSGPEAAQPVEGTRMAGRA
mgnify:CR=1 FL=1